MKKATTTMKKEQAGAKEEEGADSASQLIDARIKELGDWRGETLDESALKALILAAVALNTSKRAKP